MNDYIQKICDSKLGCHCVHEIAIMKNDRERKKVENVKSVP